MTGQTQTIASAAARLARGETSAAELLEDALDALRRDGDRFHAMLSLNPLAAEQAAMADRRRAAGEGLGPLLGIPLVLKDNIDLVGCPTTSGCRALAHAMPRKSASIVERLAQAGAVIVSKANLSEFSFEIRSRSSLGGDVLHPLAPEATAGGSSGGTAVAVARGYALGGIGTDTGGSIRIPAAYNGLAGFRPAHGAFPMDGIAPLAPSTDTVGPIARTVEDLGLLLDSMGLSLPQSPAAGLRVGVLGELFGADGGIVAVSEVALECLTRAGVTLVALPPLPAGLNPGTGDHIVDAEFAVAFDRYLQTNFLPGTAPPDLATLIAGGAFLPDYADALPARLAMKGRETGSILARHRTLTAHLDRLRRTLRLAAFAYPTSAVTPTGLDNPSGGWAPELAARTGWPAVTVCAGLTPRAMPVGIEFLGPPGSEGALLGLARAIEVRQH